MIKKEDPLRASLTKLQLKDKIKGGWAGQLIGVSFANTRSYSPVNSLSALHRGFISEAFQQQPDVYDDLFMDLTFVEAIEKKGFDCKSNVLAKAYADGNFTLTHANQFGRYNFLQGVNPPLTGHWTNNPHADDADFQLEADFIGLMSPGMPATALQIADKVGHIMSYGDGFYGGVYVANLYSLTFRYTKIQKIIGEAIKSIPERTKFYDCVTEAVDLHRRYPSDWKRSRTEILKKWGAQIRCPEGDEHTKRPDAKLSAAFLTLGLLYGNGHFSRTMEITSSLCQYSDNHMATAAGILGTLIGYNKIPDVWKDGLTEIENEDFKFTTFSLKEGYETSFKHALKNIERNGGKVRTRDVDINVQQPVTARVERSFEGHYLAETRSLQNTTKDKIEFDFEGVGFLLRGDALSTNHSTEFVFQADIYVNNKLVETTYIPANAINKHSELFWMYQLPHGKHKVRIVLLNASDDHQLKLTDLMIYDVQEVILTRRPH